jgi:hypothetical protein
MEEEPSVVLSLLEEGIAGSELCVVKPRVEEVADIEELEEPCTSKKPISLRSCDQNNRTP